MKRIIIICEGQTEQEFVNKTLQAYFSHKDIWLSAIIIKASGGGIVKWSALKKEIETLLKADPTAYVTTLIDYYGINEKHEFPSWNTVQGIADKSKRMDAMEQAMKNDLPETLQRRFVPYIQLHEFEALLFTDEKVLYEQFPIGFVTYRSIEQTFIEYDNPELINDRKETSPSHRLMNSIRGYNKIVYGNIIIEAIGLERIRSKAPRFNSWIEQLATLP